MQYEEYDSLWRNREGRVVFANLPCMVHSRDFVLVEQIDGDNGVVNWHDYVCVGVCTSHGFIESFLAHRRYVKDNTVIVRVDLVISSPPEDGCVEVYVPSLHRSECTRTPINVPYSDIVLCDRPKVWVDNDPWHNESEGAI